jgi:hypothetical protein
VAALLSHDEVSDERGPFITVRIGEEGLLQLVRPLPPLAHKQLQKKGRYSFFMFDFFGVPLFFSPVLVRDFPAFLLCVFIRAEEKTTLQFVGPLPSVAHKQLQKKRSHSFSDV